MDSAAEVVGEAVKEVIADTISTTTAESAATIAATTATSAASATDVPVPRVLAFLAHQLSGVFCRGYVPLVLNDVNFCTESFALALVAVFLAPFLWNLLGRLEYYTRALSSVFLGRRSGCTVLAAWIFFFSLYRDSLVLRAIRDQPTVEWLDNPLWHLLAGICSLVGGTFVLTSFYQLGFFGTYLGDYFGILMKERVTGFPFNVVEDPMYIGSTLLFTSMAIMEKSVAGLVLAAWVLFIYQMACVFEGPFTSNIYAQANAAKEKTT